MIMLILRFLAACIATPPIPTRHPAQQPEPIGDADPSGSKETPPEPPATMPVGHCSCGRPVGDSYLEFWCSPDCMKAFHQQLGHRLPTMPGARP